MITPFHQILSMENSLSAKGPRLFLQIKRAAAYWKIPQAFS
ncbi:hypothetical protein ANACOL_02360 [Anaerotruncus colihominis DSM 17241]|uniref:Uncharacterized protein n=1 Tax=Anaerotruncus colihominis DSM 17241 TaxID=445972 RepID=B0PC51_9FIRM|nr:hypothetical protein ANACOL_02360 [Anaerotruncus colihominis DSM 17241]